MADIEAFLDKIFRSDPEFHVLAMESIRLIDHLVSMFEDSVCLSFNGGKDCCAVLHLIRYVFWRKYKYREEYSRRFSLLKIVILRDSDEFDEMRVFIEEIRQLYSLSYIIYDCDIMTALQDLTSNHNVKIIFLGVRRGDPMTENAENIQISSDSWPKFLRANPILNWTYRHIWEMIRESGLRYCPLYDVGYSSIGKKSETVPNEALLIQMNDGETDAGCVTSCLYQPAFMLQDSSLERANRVKKGDRFKSAR